VSEDRPDSPRKRSKATMSRSQQNEMPASMISVTWPDDWEQRAGKSQRWCY